MGFIDPSGHNIGELIANGVALTTREVLALIHEVCRDAAAAFPQSPGDLWITDTGELLIARSDQIATPVDPRAGVAALLDAMLPPEGSSDPNRNVPKALRGLPARLRSSAEGVGPRDRRDLMSILSWHMNADAREVIQQLVRRVFSPEPSASVASAAVDDFDVFPAASESVTSTSSASVDDTPPARAVPVPVPLRQPKPEKTRPRTGRAFALAAVAALFVGIGSASYWLFGNDPDKAPEVMARESGDAVAAKPPVVPATDVSTTPPEAAADAAPRPLLIDVSDGAFSPAFASTGRELFFHAGRSSAGRLLVANLDHRGDVSRVSAIRDDGARDYHPRVSPDGRWIAFDSDREGERGVYVAGRDGSSLQRVSGPGYAAVPSWSPDMKWLAFVRGESARPRVWNLWLRDLATGELQRQTSFKSGQVWGASWFPDGRTLCFSHEQQLIIGQIGNPERIVIDTPKRGHLVRTPAVSPDGKSVVFQVFRDGVWLLDVKTRAMRRILDDPNAEEFAWSPDGDRIAYHSRRDGSWKIWVMPVSATER